MNWFELQEFAAFAALVALCVMGWYVLKLPNFDEPPQTWLDGHGVVDVPTWRELTERCVDTLNECITHIKEGNVPADCRMVRIDEHGTSHWECPNAFVGEAR